jgi:hypothetical protein
LLQALEFYRHGMLCGSSLIGDNGDAVYVASPDRWHALLVCPCRSPWDAESRALGVS